MQEVIFNAEYYPLDTRCRLDEDPSGPAVEPSKNNLVDHAWLYHPRFQHLNLPSPQFRLRVRLLVGLSVSSPHGKLNSPMCVAHFAASVLVLLIGLRTY